MRPAAQAGREIWFQEARNIQGYPRIYRVYTSNDIPCTSMDIPCIYFVDIPCISLDIHGISTIKDIHGISKDIPCIYHTYTIHMDEDTICMVYTRHIPGIYQKSGFQMVSRYPSRFGGCGRLPRRFAPVECAVPCPPDSLQPESAWEAPGAILCTWGLSVGELATVSDMPVEG